MSKKLPLSDFRAVRRKLEPHEFAVSEGQDAPPTHPIDEETWTNITLRRRMMSGLSRSAAACSAAGSAMARKALSCLRKPIPARLSSCSMKLWPLR